LGLKSTTLTVSIGLFCDAVTVLAGPMTVSRLRLTAPRKGRARVSGSRLPSWWRTASTATLELSSVRYAISRVSVQAPQGPHAWLSRRLFVGTLQTLRPERKAVVVRAYLMGA
jgi:hypothetical protein